MYKPIAVCVASVLLSLSTGHADPDISGDMPAGDWRHNGRDLGGSRFSPLDQVTRENVGNLEEVWRFRTGEFERIQGTRAEAKANFEAIPLVVEGTMYLSTPTGVVFALDAKTGGQRWAYDPEVELSETPIWSHSAVTSRGVSYWEDSGGALRRIVLATLDARLICLDAASGIPIASFGVQGVVDLTEGIEMRGKGHYQVTSPPAVIGRLLIVGSAQSDNQKVEQESGIVRAYDAVTGELIWGWDPIPRSDDAPGADTWRGERARTIGAANAWTVLTADPARDLVFVPTTCPSPDYYGGDRKGRNRFANSLVALRASTGEVVWDFQIVHHDLWDYDLASPPVLFTATYDGEDIPMVAQGTKMGFVFILNRETGEPIFGVEERAVAPSDAEGEEAFPTQPFPVLPPPLGPIAFLPEDAWGPDAASEEDARAYVSQFRSGALFTPPSVQGTIAYPNDIGGMNWSGASYNPESGLLFANTNRLMTLLKLIPRKELRSARRENPLGLYIEPQLQTPYALGLRWLMNDEGLPMNPPPWGVLSAIEVSTGTIAWQRPLGWMADPAKYPDAKEWGSLNFGGTITTAGSLVFIAATFDNHFRAFDAETGDELWAHELPASGQATPMAYAVEGKQYVAICAGGHSSLGTKRGDFVVSFALP